MSNDALFAIVAGGYFFGAFAIMCVIAAIYEAIAEAVERRRRKKFRNNYVRFR
jgi:hypothetical protein